MHEVEALIAKSDKLAAGARQFESAIVCPLVQGFSLLQITEAFAKELGGYQTDMRAALAKPIRYISDGLHTLAIGISHKSPVAYVSTYYFGGQGGQMRSSGTTTLYSFHRHLQDISKTGPTHQSAKRLE